MNPRMLETARAMLAQAKRAKVAPSWAEEVERVLVSDHPSHAKTEILGSALVNIRSRLIAQATSLSEPRPGGHHDRMVASQASYSDMMSGYIRQVRDIERIVGCRRWEGPGTKRPWSGERRRAP